MLCCGDDVKTAYCPHCGKAANKVLMLVRLHERIYRGAHFGDRMTFEPNELFLICDAWKTDEQLQEVEAP